MQTYDFNKKAKDAQVKNCSTCRMNCSVENEVRSLQTDSLFTSIFIAKVCVRFTVKTQGNDREI
jgi:hypothetical protein